MSTDVDIILYAIKPLLSFSFLDYFQHRKPNSVENFLFAILTVEGLGEFCRLFLFF